MRIVFVTGAPRSGTSLTTQVLKKHGFFTGKLNQLFENVEVREKTTKAYLKRNGFDPLARHKIPQPSDELAPYPSLRRDFFNILRSQRYDGVADILYKEVKFSLIWPLVHEAFPEAQWIIVRRPKPENLEAITRTPWMKMPPGIRESASTFWSSWYDKHTAHYPEMLEALDAKELWPRKFIDGDYTELEEVLEWIGRYLDPEAVTSSVNYKLYRK